MLKLAREMINAGELGEVRRYRGVHAEDYMGNPESPFTFRHDPVGGGASQSGRVSRISRCHRGTARGAFNFRSGERIQSLIEAIHRSAKIGEWTAIAL